MYVAAKHGQTGARTLMCRAELVEEGPGRPGGIPSRKTLWLATSQLHLQKIRMYGEID